MRRSKTTLMIACLAAVSLLVSCNKNENGNGDANIGAGFLATLEQGSVNGNSRSHINPESWSDGASADVLWTAGDQILVANNGGAGDKKTHTLIDGANQTEGVFRAYIETVDFLQPSYVAIYPAKNAAGTDNTIANTTATFNLPQTQVYKANSFAEKSMPMIAYSDDENLEFKNLLGGICFPIVCEDPIRVTRVVLTSANSTDNLYGVFTADCAGTADDNFGLSCTGGGGNTITLDCSGSNVTLSDDPTYFCILVPPGTLESGFKVEAYDGDIKVYEKSTTLAPGASFISRGTIRPVNANLAVVIETLTVTTVSPTFITKNSAKGIGAVSGGMPSECGILYAKASYIASAKGDPADVLTYDNVDGVNVLKLTCATATSFDADMTGLDLNTVYYVRAYAKNNMGTLFQGTDIIPFATRREYYTGANAGKMTDANGDVFQFSVSPTTKVGFSMGNLQYIGSAITPYWKFAENQLDFLGTTTGQNSADANVDRDLFGWGTSGYDCGNIHFQPWDCEGSDVSYGPNGHYDLTDAYAHCDWGVHNPISNGGNSAGQWRTLTIDYSDDCEWKYLLFNTTNASRATYRFALVNMTARGAADMATSIVNGNYACGNELGGVIVFPDNYVWPIEYFNVLESLNTGGEWNNRRITEAQWSLLEQQGAVFLPAAGDRYGTVVSSAGSWGFYWGSMSANGGNMAYGLMVQFFSVSANYLSRNNGYSVRLVCDANP